MGGTQVSNKFKGKVMRAPFRGDKTTSINVSIQNKKTDGSTWTQYADVVMSNSYLPSVPGEGSTSTWSTTAFRPSVPTTSVTARPATP